MAPSLSARATFSSFSWSEKSRAGQSKQDLGATDQIEEIEGKEQFLGEKGASPFVLKADGLYFVTEDRDGIPVHELVCTPIEVTALTRNDEARDWGYLVELEDPDGNRHCWAMPSAMMAGDGNEYRREFLSMGLRLASGPKPQRRLHDFLNYSKPLSRVTCVPRVGWHGRRFVLPDAVYGSQDGGQIILQGGPADHAFRVAGSLEDWQENVGRYCVGNSRLMVAVSAAFAAPMLAIVGQESGGFHFFGGSSTGKTTALRVAGSVCGGGGLNGYLRQWRTTDNALESIATGACDCLLALDELGQADAKTAGAVAYMLTNGQGKSRAKRDGTARKPQEWRTLFLSTGEITLGDKISEDGQSKVMAGQAVRVVDIQADAGAGLGLFENLHGFESAHEFSRHLADASAKCYGSPLRAFLGELTKNFDSEARMCPGFITEFVQDNCPPGADGQVKRVAARFGLVAYAGASAAIWDILPWPEYKPREVLSQCFQEWLQARGGSGASEMAQGVAQVRAFIQAHGASRFEVWGEAVDGVRINNRVGFKKLNDYGYWEYFIPPSTFRAEMARGYDDKKLIRELVDSGLIVPGNDGKPAMSCRVPGYQVMKCYRFSPKVLGEE